MRFCDLDLHRIGTEIRCVGAIYADGLDQFYLCYFPWETPTEEEEMLSMTLTEWTQFLQQTDRLEVMAKVVDEDGKVMKAMVRKSQRQISQAVSWAVYKRDGYRCRYCNKDGIPLTVDHLVLWEEGGPSIEANLVAACRKCNKVRGNKPYNEWLLHPHYRRVSRFLSHDQRTANAALATTLDSIPRQYVRKR